MKRVILESPYAGDIVRNHLYAQLCMLDSLKRGESPMVSHLLYTQVLNDEIQEERELGINAGLAWLNSADMHVFYVDYGYSKGMTFALENGMKNNIPFEERRIYPKI